jgi:hypothetical protein
MTTLYDPLSHIWPGELALLFTIAMATTRHTSIGYGGTFPFHCLHVAGYMHADIQAHKQGHSPKEPRSTSTHAPLYTS